MGAFLANLETARPRTYAWGLILTCGAFLVTALHLMGALH